MNHDDSPTDSEQPGERWLPLLERITGLSLMLVLTAIGWILVVAYRPAALRLARTDTEVVLVLGLLVAALALVTTVALLHTRTKP